MSRLRRAQRKLRKPWSWRSGFSPTRSLAFIRDAVRLLDDAPGAEAERLRALAILALAYVNAEQIAPARSAADQVVAAPPGQATSSAKALAYLALARCALAEQAADDALGFAEQAVEAATPLDTTEPYAPLGHAWLAATDCLLDLGRYAEAATAAERAGDAFRATSPRVRRRNVTGREMSTVWLTVALSRAGHHDRALTTGTEMVPIARLGAALRPARWRRFEAELLSAMAFSSAALRRPDAARLAGRAVDAWERVAQPHRLAQALSHRAALRGGAGQSPEADHDLARAVALYQTLAEQDPVYQGPLLDTARTRFYGLTDHGRYRAAAAVADEFLPVVRQVLQTRGAEAVPLDLVYWLAMAAACHLELGQAEQALPHAEEATSLILNGNAPVSPATRSTVLSCYGRALPPSREPEATELAERAVVEYRRHLERSGASDDAHLAGILSAHAVVLRTARRHAEAAAKMAESIEIQLRQLDSDPTADIAFAVASLRHRADDLAATGDTDAATAERERATALLRRRSAEA